MARDSKCTWGMSLGFRKINSPRKSPKISTPMTTRTRQKAAVDSASSKWTLKLPKLTVSNKSRLLSKLNSLRTLLGALKCTRICFKKRKAFKSSTSPTTWRKPSCIFGQKRGRLIWEAARRRSLVRGRTGAQSRISLNAPNAPAQLKKGSWMKLLGRAGFLASYSILDPWETQLSPKI